jgi:hypothetical protein
MSPLVDALSNIEGRLDVGLNYGEYKQAYTRAKVAYNREPVSQQSYACTHYVGVPAEKALNEYRVALNIWGACFSKPGCSVNSPGVDRRLQFRWKRASQYLRSAVNSLTG